MSDKADDSGEQEVAEPKAGQRLAKARRANDMSMRDIAKELHLDEVKVQALEDNRFDVLGAPVFAKGYLRKYAELVSVPIDDILADYYRLSRSSTPPLIVGPKRAKPAREFAPGPWIAGIVFVLVLAAAVYWFVNRPLLVSGKPVPGSVRQVLPANTESRRLDPDPEPATAESSRPDDLPEEDMPTVPDSTEPGPAPSVDSTTASEPAPVDELQVQLRFSGDCWTEVTDGNGQRLYFGLGSAGRVINVSGVPPLRLLLGNNDNVTVLVADEPYTVSPSELRGNTARLTLGGS